MLSRTALPISRVSARAIVTRCSYPVVMRSFHMSYVRPIDSKATFATIAPEKIDSKPVIPLTTSPQPEDKIVAKVESKALSSDVFDKRDFHWHHPVYTREEYESIQVQRS